MSYPSTTSEHREAQQAVVGQIGNRLYPKGMDVDSITKAGDAILNLLTLSQSHVLSSTFIVYHKSDI